MGGCLMSWKPTYSKEEVNALDEFELIGGKIKAKVGTAPNGVSYGTEAEVFTGQGDDVTGDFLNKNNNIEYSSGSWKNILQGTGLLEPLTGTQSAGPSFNFALMFDGSDSSGIISPAGSRIRFDLGSVQAINAIRTRGETSATRVKIHATNDSGYTGLVEIFSVVGNVDYFQISTVNYRYIEVETHSNGGQQHDTIEIYNLIPASINNTVDLLLPTGGGNKNFAPDSLDIRDESNLPITNSGKINVAYELDGGGFSSLEDLTLFKTREPTEFENVGAIKFRLQPVGEQFFTTVSLSTVNTEILLKENGDLQARVAGRNVFEVIGGNVFAKAVTFGEQAVTLSVEESNGTTVASATQFNGSSAGVNLESDFPIRNTILTGSNIALGKTVLEGDSSINNGDVSEQGNVGNGSPFTHRIDLGSTTQLNYAKYYTRGSNYNPSYQNPHRVDFYQSDDDTSYTLVQSFTSLGDPSNAQRIAEFDITGFNARYLRIDSYSYSGMIHTELELYLTTSAVNNNTIETKFGVQPAAIDIAPATVKLYDETGTLVTGVGKINVGFKDISGGDSAFSVLEDIQSITKNNLTGTTEFEVLLQPIGTIQVSKLTIQTVAGEILGASNGSMLFKQGGVVFGEISSTKVVFPSISDSVSIDDTDSPYQVSLKHRTVFIDPSSGNVTINLPPAASAKGQRLTFVLIQAAGGNTVTIQPDGSETINGDTSVTGLSGQYDKLELVSNGILWYDVN